MAVTATAISSNIQIKVEVGTTASGDTKYSTRTISYVDPAVTDANAYDVGDAIGNLQKYPVNSIFRNKKYELVNE